MRKPTDKKNKLISSLADPPFKLSSYINSEKTT